MLALRHFDRPWVAGAIISLLMWDWESPSQYTIGESKAYKRREQLRNRSELQACYTKHFIFFIFCQEGFDYFGVVVPLFVLSE